MVEAATAQTICVVAVRAAASTAATASAAGDANDKADGARSTSRGVIVVILSCDPNTEAICSGSSTLAAGLSYEAVLTTVIRRWSAAKARITTTGITRGIRRIAS